MATSVQPTMRKDHPGHRETMCGIFPLCSNGGDVGGLLAMRRFFFGQQGSQDETLIEVQRTCWLHGKALLRNPLEILPDKFMPKVVEAFSATGALKRPWKFKETSKNWRFIKIGQISGWDNLVELIPSFSLQCL